MYRVLLALGLSFLVAEAAQAQLVPSAPPTGTQIAELDDYLINKLRATLPEQKTFIKLVVKKVDDGKLDQKVVFAMQRYAQRRHARFPFPFFERAIRFQAGRVGVSLPTSFRIKAAGLAQP
jgi:hypothetical protein